MRERGIVDTECGASFRAAGYIATKTRDSAICPKCYHRLWPDSVPGAFDFRVAMPDWDTRILRWLAVECKYGETALSFASMDDKKRLWAQENSDEYEMWVWMCLGTSIRARRKPRMTWLFPFQLFLELEERLDRKSIPYAHPELEQYRLQWAGGGKWRLSWAKL